VNADATDNVGVSGVTFNGNAGALASGDSNTNGTWSYTTPVQTGHLNLNPVTATDLAGNTDSVSSASKLSYNNVDQALFVLGSTGGDTINAAGGATVSITDTASNGGGNTVNASGGGNWVEIHDKAGGDTIGVSGNANTVVLTGNSAGSTVTVNGTGGYDVVRVKGGATVSITDSALHAGSNTVTANGGGNSVTINDKGGGDTISFGGDGNTLTLSGTGGGDHINFGGSGGNDTLVLDAMPKGGYDSISNFIAKSNSAHTHDTIDVSSLGITQVDNNFTVNKGVVDLAADSVAWLTAGNQSAVYINTANTAGAATEALVVNGSLNAGDFTLKPKV
jgi:hypothetical protein